MVRSGLHRYAYGKSGLNRGKVAPVDSTNVGSLRAMSRIRPARGAIERGII